MMPINDRYAKIKIAKIPNGPAVTGVVIFNKTASKPTLTMVDIKINVFIISYKTIAF